MGTMTPAQRRALYESARFARENYYTGPLGPTIPPAAPVFGCGPPPPRRSL